MCRVGVHIWPLGVAGVLHMCVPTLLSERYGSGTRSGLESEPEGNVRSNRRLFLTFYILEM